MTPDQSPPPTPRADDHAVRLDAAMQEFADAAVIAAKTIRNGSTINFRVYQQARDALRALALSRPAPQPTHDEHVAAVEAWRRKVFVNKHCAGAGYSWDSKADNAWSMSDATLREALALMAHRPAAEPAGEGAARQLVESFMDAALKRQKATRGKEWDECQREVVRLGEQIVAQIVAQIEAKHRRPSGDAAGCAGLVELREWLDSGAGYRLSGSSVVVDANSGMETMRLAALREINKLLAARQPAAGGAARDGGA